MTHRILALVLLAAPAAAGQVFSPPRPAEEPAEKPAGAEAPGSQDPAKRADPLAAHWEAMRAWPADGAKKAALVLAGAPGESRDRLVRGLEDRDWRIQSGSAFGLAAVGEQRALPVLRAQILDDSNRAALPEFLRAIVAIDPENGPLSAAPFLAHRDSRIRAAARNALPRRLPDALVPDVVRLASNSRSPVRILAMELLGSLGDDAPLEEMIAGLADPESGVARIASRHLAESRREGIVDSLFATALDAPARPSMYAVIALVMREDLQKIAILPDDGPIRDRLVRTIQQDDHFYRGGAAIALSNISFRSDDPFLRTLADEYLVPILIDTVAGGSFFADYSSLEPLCWQKLELLTGAGLGPRADAWIRYWNDNRTGFVARRTLRSLRKEDLRETVLTVRRSGAEGGGSEIVLAGSVSLLAGRPGAFLVPEWRHGEWIEAIEKAALFAGGAEPAGPSAPRWEATVEIPRTFMVYRRVHPDGAPPSLEPLDDYVDRLAEELAWQRFAPYGLPERAHAWFAEQDRWFEQNREPAAIQVRILRLALEAFEFLADGEREFALERFADAPADWIRSSDQALAAHVKRGVPFTESLDRFLRHAGARNPGPHLADAILDAAGGSPSVRASTFLHDFLATWDLDRLEAAIGHPQPRVRAHAARALVRFAGDPAVGRRLLQLMQDPDGIVRDAALDSLSMARDDSVLGVIDGVLQGEDAAMRIRAIEALARIAGPQGVPRLMDVYRRGGARERWAVVKALPAAGGAAAVQALAALVRETNSEYPFEALSALIEMQEPEVSEALVAILDRSPQPELRGMAMDALTRREGLAALPHVEPWLRREDEPRLARIALLSLARLGVEKTLPLLIEAVSKPDGDDAAETAIGDLAFYQSEHPSPPLRAMDIQAWAERHGNLKRGDWFLLAAGQAGVSLDASIGWLGKPSLGAKDFRDMMELFQRGSRPLREQADRIIQADLGLDLGPPGDDPEEWERRIAIYRTALQKKPVQ